MIALALISVFSCTCIGPRSLSASEQIVGRPSARPREDRASLKLVVAVTPGVSEAIVQGALNEATAIWGAAAITIDWRLADAGSLASEAATVQVVFEESGGSVSGPTLPLGWVNFDASGTPESIVHVSPRNVLQLLDATAAYRDRPTSYRELLEARALGRALAHELGHQLMASKLHSRSGLMKAHRVVDDLFSPSRAGFMLSDDDRQRAASALHVNPASESQQPVDLHDERTVLQASHQARSCEGVTGRVALVGVDDEQLAAGAILPSEPEVAAECVIS